MKIKVLQRNVWFKERVENLITVIKELNPDIICCQEITIGSWFNDKRDVAQFIAQELGYYYYFSNAHKYEYPITPLWEENYWGNAIFSKFPIIDSYDFPLINPEDLNDHPYERRTCAVARIQIENSILTVATTHKSYSSGFIEDQDKIAETKKIINFIEKEKWNLILTWDFNLAPDSDSVRMILQYLQHVGPDCSQSTWTTKPFSFMGFEENELKWRLDYIFVSKKIKVLSSTIIPTEYSDHLPIFAECELN